MFKPGLENAFGRKSKKGHFLDHAKESIRSLATWLLAWFDESQRSDL